MYQAGVDSTQALGHALCIIPDELIELSRKHSGRFTWFEMDNLGYPLRVPIQGRTD